MVEFLVALALFTLTAATMFTAQINGSRLQQDALQHSQAVHYAADYLRRIRANTTQVEAYVHEPLALQDADNPIPESDCRLVNCTPAELSQFDLWQWRAIVKGQGGLVADAPAGALTKPIVCTELAAGVVTVSLSWAARVVANKHQVNCTDEEADAAGRQQVTVSSYVGNSHLGVSP